jgi:hypothetical protein
LVYFLKSDYNIQLGLRPFFGKLLRWWYKPKYSRALRRGEERQNRASFSLVAGPLVSREY